MKILILAAVIGTGLIWSCQDKSADQSQHSATMNHEMTQAMEHDMDHSHDKMSMGSESKMEHKQMNTAGNIAYYTCPMESHKYIHSSEPGACPDCGMDLVAVTKVSPDQADYYGCPMPEHSQVRSDQPGQCPECGMNLKPFKLEQADS